MSKKSRKKIKPNEMKHNGNDMNGTRPISSSELRSLITDAIKEAMVQLRENGADNKQDDKTITSKANNEKAKWWKKLMVVIGLLFCPVLIHRYLKKDNRIQDDLLSVLISVPFTFAGIVLWAFGLYFIVCSVIMRNVFSVMMGIGIWIIGAFVIMAAISFSKEKDSMRLYAFSASFLAFVSCVVSCIMLFLTTRK